MDLLKSGRGAKGEKGEERVEGSAEEYLTQSHSPAFKPNHSQHIKQQNNCGQSVLYNRQTCSSVIKNELAATNAMRNLHAIIGYNKTNLPFSIKFQLILSDIRSASAIA